ncbi:hypothetical protein AMTRI_Chr08g163510 [Amborella trichopoda]|uniref:Uncharacterized protein n=1 Tax=Amborella trichopoda TaxID=13333 RepID=W1NT28_AMBTC|nr:hypothetical protein AMTR_s00997p00008590 [Amborella trichopoda]
MVGEETGVSLCSIRRKGERPLPWQNLGKSPTRSTSPMSGLLRRHNKSSSSSNDGVQHNQATVDSALMARSGSMRPVSSIFLAKDEGLPLLAYVSPGALVRRKTLFFDEFVVVMHSLIAGGADVGPIRTAKHRCLCFVASAALYLHVLPFLWVKETVTEDNSSRLGNTNV